MRQLHSLSLGCVSGTVSFWLYPNSHSGNVQFHLKENMRSSLGCCFAPSNKVAFPALSISGEPAARSALAASQTLCDEETHYGSGD